MRIRPPIDHTLIVLEGSFNPAIFHPAWFALHGMIAPNEAENPQIWQTNQESRFNLNKFGVHVQPQLFSIYNLNNHYSEHIKDIVSACFSGFLPHTPIRSMQIKRFIHFNAGSLEDVSRVWALLAPKQPWGDWGEEMSESFQNSVEKRDGMASITMAKHTNFNMGDISVLARVEPSLHLSSTTGIFVEAENRFNFLNKQAIQDASLAIRVLESEWENSLERTQRIFDQIMKLAGCGEQHEYSANS